MSQALPDLFACVNPAVGEILDARDRLRSHIDDLAIMLSDLVEANVGQHVVSTGLAAEDSARAAQDVARVALQIQGLATSVHRGVAKRLHLEPRI